MRKSHGRVLALSHSHTNTKRLRKTQGNRGKLNKQTDSQWKESTEEMHTEREKGNKSQVNLRGWAGNHRGSKSDVICFFTKFELLLFTHLNINLTCLLHICPFLLNSCANRFTDAKLNLKEHMLLLLLLLLVVVVVVVVMLQPWLNNMKYLMPVDSKMKGAK